MIRKLFVFVFFIVVCGCSQINVSSLPLMKPKVDQNLTQYAAVFVGSVGNKSNIAEATKSVNLHKRALGVVASSEIDQYLNGVLGCLQKNVPGMPPAARVYVTPNTEFGAVSHQDGGIYISYKMLSALESEDEVAAVISHEYSHVILNHYKTNWIDDATKVAYSIGNSYINKQLEEASLTDVELLRMALMNDAALESFQVGLVPALTREQENEADQLGLDLLLRADYSLLGYFDFFSRMQSWELLNDEIQKKRKSNYIDLFSEKNSNTLLKEIDHKIDDLEEALTQMVRQASQHHDKAEERSKILRAYLKSHYPNVRRSDRRDKPYKVVMESKKTKKIFASLDFAHKSAEALQQNNLPDALVFARQADKDITPTIAFNRHVLINALGTH